MDNLYKYFSTDNAKLLEEIIRAQLKNTGLSQKEPSKITKDHSTPKEDIFIAIKLCEEVVKEYINIKGALCKGELKVVGGKVFEAPPWAFNQYIIERRIKKAENLDLKKILLEEGIKYEKLFGLIKKLEEPRILSYKEVAKRNHLIWFRDYEKAIGYTKNFLTELYIIEEHTKKEVKKELDKKEIYIPKEITKNISHEEKELSKKNKVFPHFQEEKVDKIITPEEFIIKYSLGEEHFKGDKSSISKEEIERTLTREGLVNKEHIRDITRRISKNPEFADIFKIPKTKEYSKEKFRHLTKKYMNCMNQEQEELFEEIKRIFKLE